MINLQKVIIPAIIIGVIAGVTLFFLAFNLYPHKHVNINFNGKCYEFLNTSYEKYRILELQKEKYTRQLQLDAIENTNAIIPIVFSGSSEDVNNFVKQNKINVINSETIGNNSKVIDKVIVKGIVSKQNLEKLVNEFPLSVADVSKNPVLQSMGIESNQFITSEEGINISKRVQNFMNIGIKNIIDTTDGVKPAECRTQITYNENR